jgi:LytR cell envelope-related transcriptional attenuator
VTETQGPPVDSDWEPRWDTEPQPAPDPRPRAGSGNHRAPLGLTQAAGRVFAPLAAVGVVVAVILMLIWINGRPASIGAAGAPTGAVTPGSRTTPVAPAQPAAASPRPTRHHASSSPSATAPSRHHRTSTTTAAIATAKAPVQVLNNSRVTGLAHEVAALVESKGWHVTTVGNLQGAIPEPTVYYSAGNKAAAEHLAREFGSIRRVEPNSAVGLTAAGITLVLTAAWSG